MRVTFFANACNIYEADGFRLLTDPWLTDGAFEGSWFHYPPFKTTPDEVSGVDALYISHLHPDHYDEKTLESFRRDIPIVILDHGRNYLQRKLQSLGFSHIIGLHDGTDCRLGPFTVTVYAPFTKHPFHDSETGNFLDSAVVVRSAEHSVLNANDNTPSLDAARQLAERHGKFTVAQLNYNAAGPFPSCFNNLSEEEKQRAHGRVLERNLGHLVDCARILDPHYVMPFAGSYVIGGRQWKKNQYLGTTTWDHAADYIRERGLNPLVLNERLTFDLNTERIVNGVYERIDTTTQQQYIENVLSEKRYTYEDDGERDAETTTRDWVCDAL